MRASKTSTVWVWETVWETLWETVAGSTATAVCATATNEPVSRLTKLHDTTSHMHELISGFETIVSAHTNESMADEEDITTHSDEIFNPTATNKNSAPPSANMAAAMDLPNGTASSQNLTSSNCIVWTPRINAFATASYTLLGRILRMMNLWSSLMSILAIFALLYWTIVLFICDCIVVAVATVYGMLGGA